MVESVGFDFKGLAPPLRVSAVLFCGQNCVARLLRDNGFMEITIRDAVAGDVPALRELFLRSRRETFVWQPSDAFQLSDFDTQTEGERLLVAEDDSGQLAGFISVWEPDHFIHHLYVCGRRHRRGIGRALLRALPGWPATRYRLKCLRANAPALAFYRASCFTEIGVGAAEDGEYLLLESSGDDGE